MTCQFFGAVCVLCSLVMTSYVSSRSLDHAVPPVIVEGPKFLEYFNPGSTRTWWPCVATGSQPIAYKWLRNGELIKAGGHVMISEGTLELHFPPRDMEGYYQCFASNGAGVAVSNVTLFQAAVLTSSLSTRQRKFVDSRLVLEAQSLVLRCNHVNQSIPSPSLSWQFSKGTDFLPVRMGERISQTEDGSLVFSFVRKNDSGNYKCEAYNRILLQELRGSNVNLTVGTQDGSTMERKIQEAPILLFSSSNVTIVEGDDLTLTCLFGSWPQGYEVNWTTPAGSSYTIAGGSSFTIRNASDSDGGLYTCKAHKTTSLGTQLYSQMVTMSVQVDALPSFTILPTNQEIAAGHDVTFTCRGQGRPAPIVTWYTNGTPLDNASNHFTFFEGSTPVLTVKDVNATATITCNISNVHGYRLHTAIIAYAAKSDHDDITSPSSQSRVISTWKATAKPAIKSTEMSTQPYQAISTTSYQAVTSTQPEKPVAFPPNQSSQTAENVIITGTSVGVVVALCVVVVIVTIVIYLRRRRIRQDGSGQPAVDATNRPPPPPQAVLIWNDVHDSDDSGFDDVRTENAERRNLRRL